MKLKDLELRTYEDKKCTGFTYFLDLGDNKKQRFDFSLDNHPDYQDTAWKMVTLIEPGLGETQVYNTLFVAPRKGLPLTTIAMMGLKLFQSHLKEEIQMKSNIDFGIGQVTTGDNGLI